MVVVPGHPSTVLRALLAAVHGLEEVELPVVIRRRQRGADSVLIDVMKPVQQLASWLFTVARNKITDSYRKQKTASLNVGLQLGEEDDDTFLLSEILRSNDDQADTVLMRESIMEAVFEGLEELPVVQKEVFEMHELEGLKFEQIAEITGVPVKTLISRKRYAVMYLRDKLQFLYDDLLND